MVDNTKLDNFKPRLALHFYSPLTPFSFFYRRPNYYPFLRNQVNQSAKHNPPTSCELRRRKVKFCKVFWSNRVYAGDFQFSEPSGLLTAKM
jgi:hypothetical protein